MLEASLLEAREEMTVGNQAISAKFLPAIFFQAFCSTRPTGWAAAHNDSSPESREGVLGCGSIGGANLRYTWMAETYPTHVY